LDLPLRWSRIRASFIFSGRLFGGHSACLPQDVADDGIKVWPDLAERRPARFVLLKRIGCVCVKTLAKTPGFNRQSQNNL
jgi:hypothetical protein